MTFIREQFYKRRIAELSKHSSNSSKPPSSDTVRPPNPKQSGASRRHGGQPGHKGNNNIRWLKHLIFHSTAIILLSLCTGRIAIADALPFHVWPISGYTSTDFYWSVHYYDADGDWPDTKNVYVDGTSYQMELDPGSGSESNGTYRCGPMNLGVGSHNYYFYFTDGQGGIARLPPSGSDTFSGPLLVDDDVKATVPNVVGMAQADAISAIISAYLTVGTVTNAYSSTVPAGDVISQVPLGETLVDMDSTVDLVVSSDVGLYHPADTDNDYVLSMLEILGYQDQWALGNVTMLEVLEAMNLWSAGHYYWDESEQKFKPGEQSDEQL